MMPRHPKESKEIISIIPKKRMDVFIQTPTIVLILLFIVTYLGF